MWRRLVLPWQNPHTAPLEDMGTSTTRALSSALKVMGFYHISNHCHTVLHQLYSHPYPRGQLRQELGLWSSLLCQAELPVH